MNFKDHRNDIKCSKLKWNHELLPKLFQCKDFESVDHQKMWSIGFIQLQWKLIGALCGSIKNGFLVWTPHPSGISTFASYFLLKILAIENPSEFPMTIHVVGIDIFWNHAHEKSLQSRACVQRLILSQFFHLKSLNVWDVSPKMFSWHFPTWWIFFFWSVDSFSSFFFLKFAYVTLHAMSSSLSKLLHTIALDQWAAEKSLRYGINPA